MSRPSQPYGKRRQHSPRNIYNPTRPPTAVAQDIGNGVRPRPRARPSPQGHRRVGAESNPGATEGSRLLWPRASASGYGPQAARRTRPGTGTGPGDPRDGNLPEEARSQLKAKAYGAAHHDRSQRARPSLQSKRGGDPGRGLGPATESGQPGMKPGRRQANTSGGAACHGRARYWSTAGREGTRGFHPGTLTP